MIEDDIYRSSSQYRLWSYTRASLARIRQETNELAAQRVRAAFRRARSAQSQNGGGPHGSEEGGAVATGDDAVIDTLTVEEELKIVEWGCSKIVDMGEAMNPRIPSHVVATATQYLRRFYLTQSPMTYHPKAILPSALYLATKADHFYLPLSRFVAELHNISEDDVKAPEFLLLQGLRFTLDVRHPMKGLQGGHVEMNVLAEEGKLGAAIEPGRASERRIGMAADQAKKLLATAAQLTDAYFLFTPSQIWLGAIMVADRDLCEAYLNYKFEGIVDAVERQAGRAGGHTSDVDIAALQAKLLATINSCAELLQSYTPPEEESATQRKEMRRIGKKLNVCQNPEKTDIVAVARAKAAEKREGSATGSGSDAEKVAKKRRLERERAEREGDVFGPALKDIPGKDGE
ncbi:hypothetical protein A1O7_02815 [Cladophialophora yegresii CBS 114405]|uniref:RNA polymerase II holoenzyme cyclin-like subunit n=1 Tax=Cladophialophora yegresii CBS 114405 TaxID=1182544 RepID=W9WCV7_9EURO|nr:uncharacterized protein A1O7_02815 [Cladophialophora yegresii CBS 114405]EXJ62381.1 hypothetical protein A1O7_02815 [Cladophialophora yegresii CBS 114405]